MTPPLKHLPVGIRFVLITALFFFNTLLFSFVGASVIAPIYGMDKVTTLFTGHFASDTDKYLFLFVQGVASLGTFAFTALLVSQLETGFVARRLSLKVMPAIKVVAVAIVSILVAQAFIEFLVEINQSIHLPNALKFLAEQGKIEEELMNALLAGSSFNLFCANTLVMAVIPAIGEEFFFRGLILGELLKSKFSPAYSIMATGLLFSLAHWQFDNLLAIWVLGSFLGYLYYMSGSIWVSVSAHFVNNFLLILLKYLYNSGVIKQDITEADIPVYAIVFSTLLFVFCFYILNKWRRPVDFELELSEPELLVD